MFVCLMTVAPLHPSCSLWLPIIIGRPEINMTQESPAHHLEIDLLVGIMTLATLINIGEERREAARGGGR